MKFQASYSQYIYHYSRVSKMMADIGLSSRIVFIPEFIFIDAEWILLNAAKRKALVKKYTKQGFLEGGNFKWQQQRKSPLKKRLRKKLPKRDS